MLEREEVSVKLPALEALQTVENAIASNSTSGQARRLLRFLAGVYTGQDCPSDLTELRALDQTLANACLDYLNYDRLGHTELHTHLAGDDALLNRQLADAGIQPGLPNP